MFNNVKAKKRLTQLIIAFVVICMSVTGSFMLLNDTIEEATAATVSVDVNSADTWRSAVSGRGNGDIVNVRLTGDVSVGALLQAIPTGVTVNLNMNGKGIYWDTVATGTASIMDENYGDGIRSDFWGLITNNGTLNISGTGTIRMKKINYNYKTNGEKNNFATKSCAIVNNGTMVIGSGISVENYTALAANDQDGTNKFMDTFIYGCAIYNNSGTLTTSGKILSSTMGGGIAVSGSNSYHYAFSYGIYGGTITTKGGSVTSEAKAGCLMATSSCKEGNQVGAIATGIYGNGAQILGDTTISAKTSTWDSPGGYDCWSEGIDISIATGVMYTGTNYPVIGASVDIDATFFCPGGNEVQMYVPGTGDYYTVKNKTGPSNYARRAYPIAGAVKVQNTIGDHKSEMNWSDGNFFGTPGSGSNNVENNFNMNGNMYYYPEESYFGNVAKDRTTVNANGQFKRESGQNNAETLTGQFRSGVPGTAGTQFKVMYRYYDGEISSSKLISVSPSADTAKHKQAFINVGGSANKTGAATDAGASFTFGSGGESVNSKYYELQSKTYEKVPTATFASRDYNNKNNWSSNATQFTGAVNMTPENTLVVYMNYVLKTPEAIRIVATNDQIYASTKETSFSVAYTGKEIVPGTDFQLGIIGMGIGTSVDTNDTGDDTVVTGRYDINRNDTSKVRVDYRYTTDQVTWTNGLPKDVGTYKIEVSVAADTEFSSASENRLAQTSIISATITKVDVKIDGKTSRDVVYGSTYAQQIPFGEYTATGKGSDALEGSWTFAGFSPDAVPAAGQSTVYLVWTPKAGTKSAANYNATTFAVALNVAKKPVTVNAGASTVAYGDSKPTYVINYVEGLAEADKALMTEYLNNTVFVVKNSSGDFVRYNINEWAPAVGSYELKIETFGGIDNPNYSFSVNSTSGTLTVTKRNIVYTASAADRAYNGSADVDVTLNYASGNLSGDIYDAVIKITGTMPAGANAGEGKQVTVDTSKIVIKNPGNYNLVVSNADAITVNIAKAKPAGVKVVAADDTIVYDASATLEKDVALKVTESAIPGSWSWKTVDGKSPTPTVDQAIYTAVFTPADAINYTTLEQDVTLTVEQKEVKISVKDPKTGADFVIPYGSAVPAISGSIKYDGFTGKDDITNIGANGSVDASTTYTRGAAVNMTDGYAVNIVSSLTSTNYYFTAVPSKIYVEKATLTVTVADEKVTFGSPVPELNVSDLRFEGFYNTENYTDLGGTVSVTTTYTPGASVGEYPITASGYTSANYNIVYVDGVLTVNKAVLTVVPNDVKGVQYGADAPDYTGGKLYTFVDANGNKVVTSVTGDPVFTTQYKSGKDAGVYPVTVSVNNMTATNYSFVGQEGTLTVGKADPKINEVPGATVVNTHKFSEATFDGAEVVVNPYNATMTVEGTFAFTDADKVAVWGANGMYDVVFTPADSHNYNVVYSKVANGGGVWLEITEKLVTGKPVIQGSAMAGSTLTLVLDSMDPSVREYYNIEWYADNAKLSGVTGLTYTLATSDIGKTFKVKLIPITSKGFTNGGTDIWSDPTSAVIEALLETTAAQFKAVFADAEYDSFSHAATVTLADGYNPAYFGDITVKYNGLTAVPVKAGKYTVTVDVGVPEKPEGGYTSNTYYGPATGIVLGQFEITKATLDISIAVEDKIYDGTTAITNAVFAPVGLKDEMDIVGFASGTKFVFADPNAGQNKKILVSNIGLVGEDASNYKINPEIKVTANILPRTIYFDAFGVDKVYDGTRGVDVTFRYNIDANEVAGAGYAAVDSASSVYPVNGKADAETADALKRDLILENISCVLAGSSAKNYVAAFSNEGNATVKITQATPDVESLVINGVTYNAQQKLENLNILLVPYSTDGTWIFKDGSIVPTVNQNRYTAIYTPNNKNYKAVEKVITVNVEPLSVTLWPQDTTISYGSKSPVIKIGPEVLPDGTLLTEIGGSCTPIHGYYPGAGIGSYPVTLNNAYTDDNYAFTTMPGTLTVAPARLNVTAVATDKVYDGTTDIAVNFTVVSGKYGNDDVALNETSTIGQAFTANAGPTTVSYIAPILVGSKAENYELNVTPASGVLTVTINKADVTGVIFPVDATVQFGYDLRYAEFEIDGVGDGTFAFENAKDIVPPAVDFYEYKVVFTPRDSRNYNTQERMVSLEVVKCVLDYIVGVAGTAQDGETLSVVFTGLPSHAEPYMQYQWYRMDDKQIIAIPGATEAKYVATEDDIGYTIAVVTYIDEAQAPFVYADGACEEGFGETDVRCIVAASDSTIKEISLTFWQRLLDWLRRIIAVLTGVQLNGGLGL